MTANTWAWLLIRILKIPGEKTEPTDTIVLTSKDGTFVDVRLRSEVYENEKGNISNSEASLQWAFAGKSRVTSSQRSQAGEVVSWHNVWDHFIDSKSDEPEKDEGDMSLQEDGTVLEKGVHIDATTGAREEYEELWSDLEIETMGTKGHKSSIVVRTESKIARVQGLVVKVGGYCQGLLKKEGRLTVERWQKQARQGEQDHENALGADFESMRTRNNWVRVFKLGQDALPCEYVWSVSLTKMRSLIFAIMKNSRRFSIAYLKIMRYDADPGIPSSSRTDGRIGSNAVFKDDSEVEWRVTEEYYF